MNVERYRQWTYNESRFPLLPFSSFNAICALQLEHLGVLKLEVYSQKNCFLHTEA